MFDFLVPTWTVYPFMKEFSLPNLTLPALLICSVICLPPALISSLNSVYDSVLPTWYLTPGIDLCLYDLSCEVIKLHMDLNDTASSLQKTSPEIDPAVFFHFTTEVSAQAPILVTHQQQLTRLTLLTEEMITALRDLRQQHPWPKHLPQALLLQPRLHQHPPPVLGWRSLTSLMAHPRSVRVSYCNARCL